METIEIIFIALGVFLLIASCFIKQKENAPTEIDYDGLVQHLSRRELSQEEIEKIRRVIASIVAECREKIIEETDDYLSKVANEKSISVNDFSEQIMERLNVNHKEVVFLYNMLNEKEAEIKETIGRMSDVERNAALLIEELEEKKNRFGEVVNNRTQREVERTVKEEPIGKQMLIAPVQQSKKEEKRPDTEKKEPMLSVEELLENNTKEILALHRKGKSVVEISKALGLGQGEVRLIVDLYGN